MDCTFEELIDKYIAGTVFVSIKELEDEGLLQEFCNRVEKIAPSTKGAYTHRGLYDYHVNEGLLPRKYCFKMHKGSKGTRFCILQLIESCDKIAHLINDVPPVDMEELLKM